MSAPPETTLFSIRIVSLDYYMAAPIPGFDTCYTSLDGRSVKEVPVIRIFGPTPAGQKACLHIHGVLPFFYIPFPVELLQSSKEGDQYMKALMTALEKALNQNVSTTKRCVHGYILVRAKKIYGYHPLEDLFIKIYLYHPRDVVRAANILLDGAVLGRNFQPYESHIPYLLHFLVDYNLCGMSHVHSSKIKFRSPLPDSFVGKMANQKKNDLEGVGKEAVRESAIWVSSMISSSLMWSDSASQCSIEKLSAMPRRQSICELEGDSVVDDILNEKNKIFTSLSESKSKIKMVQSLVSIWEEFERYGVQEMTKPLELTQPHPEYVLKKFLRGLQYDNQLSNSLATMHESFPENGLVSESGEKLKVHIESQTRTDVYCRTKQCQLRSAVLVESTDNHEGNNTSNMSRCLPSDDKEEILLCSKVSDAHELRTSKRISSNSSNSEEEMHPSQHNILVPFNLSMYHFGPKQSIMKLVDREYTRESMIPYTKEGNDTSSNSRTSSFQPRVTDAGESSILINFYHKIRSRLPLNHDKEKLSPKIKISTPSWPPDMNILHFGSGRGVKEFLEATTTYPWSPPRAWIIPWLNTGPPIGTTTCSYSLPQS